MRMLYSTRPYEEVPGSADRLYDKWSHVIYKNIRNGSIISFKHIIKQIVHDFDNLPLKDIKKPKIGVVGEILVKNIILQPIMTSCGLLRMKAEKQLFLT